MKGNKFLLIVYVLTFIFTLTGATFAYFSQTAASTEGAVNSTSAVVTLELDIEPLYTSKDLITMDDSDVNTAYRHNCIDDNDYGACQAYTLTIKGANMEMNLEGSINFTLTDITNLKYKLIEIDPDTDEITDYQPMTTIEAGEDQSLGPSFTLDVDEERSFVLIIWLPNFEEDQNDYDGGGSFSASVTYETPANYRLTGSLSGN